MKERLVNLWNRLSYLGITRAELGSVDRIVLTNQFVLIAVGLISSYNIFYLLYDPVLTAPLIIINVTVSFFYLSVLWINSRGYPVMASVVALGAPMVQLTVLSYMLSNHAGVHIYLLCAAALSFLMFPENRPWLRTSFVIIPTLTFLVVHFFFTPEHAVIRFSSRTLNGLYISSILTFSFVLYVTAHLFHAQIMRQREMIARQAQEMEIMAHTDILTSLPNRRHLISILDREMNRGGAYSYVLAIADIDHFKTFNDRFGHDCGDFVLEEVASRFQKTVRTSDVVGRWGGEEFIFVFPDTSLALAETLLERIRASVEEDPIEFGGKVHTVTVSIGATEVLGESSYDEGVKRADEALYQGKEQGRNCVIIF
ncbi:MAG TPA: diguanylate cyclase [Nitrospiria bacterium]